MWKAAHIKLANYLRKQEELKNLNRHKVAFFVGSILPDCMPSFVSKRHRMEDTFSVLEEEIQKLQVHNKVDFYFCLHLGVVVHYIADYFTYPHNKTFHGNFLEHCVWERKQQQYLTNYLRNLVISAPVTLIKDWYSYLLKKHGEYLKQGVSLLKDCQYITEVTYDFAVYLLQATEVNGLYEEIRKKWKLQ